MTPPWAERVAALYHQAASLPRQQVVERIADLAFEETEATADAWLDEHLAQHARDADAEPPLAALYLQYLLDNEAGEARRLAATARPGARFADIAGAKARTAYQRVSALFEHVDFAQCRRMVMVGCGPLPVTALHVVERTGIAECLLLDVDAAALADCASLVEAFGQPALRPCRADGASFDYAGAQVVYVANVVRPKAATLRRIAATAGPEVQVVLREPWSLGRLWAESAERAEQAERAERGDAATARPFDVVARGPVSRHLSRDVILRRRPPR